MSGFAETAIIGVLVGLGGAAITALGAVFLAGAAIAAAGKGAIALGRAVSSARQKAEETRLRKAREEYSAVSGELGRMAQERHDYMARTEERLQKEYDLAVEKREEEMDRAYREIAGAKGDMKKMVEKLPQYFAERSRVAQESTIREIEHFSAEMDADLSRMMVRMEADMRAKQSAAMAALDAADLSLDRRRAGHQQYAVAAKAAVDALMSALERNYDCGKFAPAEYETARETARQIDELLRRGDDASLAAAAQMAGSYEQYAMVLQVRAEQRTACFHHEQAALAAQAAELKEMIRKTHELEDAEKLKDILGDYISEEQGADYWSEGRLGKLWEEGEILAARAEAYTYQNGDNPTVLLSEIQRINNELVQEHARTRAFLLSRVQITAMMVDLVDTLMAEGWELKEEPTYHLNKDGVEDERLAMQLVFEKDGDEMTYILHDEFDPATHQYRQKVLRLMNEAGLADEQARGEIDDMVSERMQQRGHEGFSLGCNQASAGQKKTKESVNF